MYRNEFNCEALSKIFRENALEFKPLFSCDIYVFMASSHPLAGKEKITFEDLRPYPNLAFGQGDNNSFYLAEEVFSTHEYRQSIKADDRATMLNLMIGLNGYTLCSGIICNELNGDEYVAVPFDTDEKMEIGYIKKKNMPLTVLGEKYIAELKNIKHTRKRKMILYVIRHGETAWNKVRRLQGQTDIPLAEEGIRLAKETGIGMKDIPIDLVISSLAKSVADS